jgi:DeoR/GlpR family transcriptional regulator of sugar metabolism
MLSATRRDKILNIVKKKQSATVTELSRLLNVSEVTVRQDLNRMAADGLIVRTHGGAIAAERGKQEFTFSTRDKLNADQKQHIGQAAAALIQPHDSIILDASTTALYIARAILQRNNLGDLTIITNGIHTALELAERSDITTILTGGIVRASAFSTYGSFTWEILAQVNVNKGFFGVGGISLEQGLTDLNVQEVNVKKAMAERCQEIIAVADGTKFGEIALTTFVPIERLAHIVTDTSAPAALVEALRARGVNVIIA